MRNMKSLSKRSSLHLQAGFVCFHHLWATSPSPSSTTLPNFPYSLGMGKALAPSSQYNKWGQIQVLGQENWTPPPHSLELLHFLMSMGTTEAIERGNGVITQ